MKAFMTSKFLDSVCEVNYEKMTESRVIYNVVLFMNFKLMFTLVLRYQYFHYVQYGDLSAVEFVGYRLSWKDQG